MIFSFFLCVFFISGCILGPDVGFGGRCVSDGAGVCLPLSWMRRREYGTYGVAWRALPALCHSALWAHCRSGRRDFPAHAATQP